MKKPRKVLLFILIAILIPFIIIALGSFFGLEYHATKALKKEIDYNIKQLSKYIVVEYDTMGVNWLAFTVNLKKVKLSKPPLPGFITIDKVSVRDLTTIGIKWITTVVAFDNIILTNEETSIGAEHFYTTFRLKDIPSHKEMADDWTVILKNLLTGEVKLNKFSFSDKETQIQINAEEAHHTLDKGTQRSSSLKINDLKFQKEDLQFQCDAFTLAVSLTQENVITHMAHHVKNFSFHLPAGLAHKYPFFQKVTSLGYEHLTFGTDLNYNYQPESKNLSLTWDGSVANMGKLHFDLGLTDYVSPPVPLSGGLVRFLIFLQQLSTPSKDVSLHGLKVRYQDLGLVPRLIKAEAQSRNQSAEDFTKKLVGTINTSLFILPLPASLKEQIKAVNRFLSKPEEIQLDITCKKPLRLKKLEEGSLEGLLDLLENAEVKITSK